MSDSDNAQPTTHYASLAAPQIGNAAKPKKHLENLTEPKQRNKNQQKYE